MRGAFIKTSARRLKNEAENETKKETAFRMLKRGKMTIEEIAEDSGLGITEAEQLAGMKIMLKQIEDKKYAASLGAKGIPADRIKKYGFAFKGKEVLIG